MARKKNRSIVIIDGSNFYYKLKSLKYKETINFEYSKWIKSVVGDSKIVSKYYCIGKIKASQNNKKARKMMAKQQSLVTRLVKLGFVIRYGYLLKSGGKYHEKGVDVQMAVDMLRDVYKNKCDQVVVVSSDSDLIPAIEEVQNEGKEVLYIGFKHQPSYALLKACKRSMLLEKQDVEEFVK